LWKNDSQKFNMELKQNYSQFEINNLEIATEIIKGRKYRRDKGKAVMNSDEIDENLPDFEKLRKLDITGRAFLRLTEEKLTCKPDLYELKPSPAEGIMELVEELNKKQKKEE
ncbi:1153_t:CDS:2, partial [Acaulospora morrowiae]